MLSFCVCGQNQLTMEIEEVIKICKDRNELNFLFSITKQIAEEDSIGEGYHYCSEYEKEYFDTSIEVVELRKNPCEDYHYYYLVSGVMIYELYLYQIGAVAKQNGA